MALKKRKRVKHSLEHSNLQPEGSDLITGLTCFHLSKKFQFAWRYDQITWRYVENVSLQNAAEKRPGLPTKRPSQSISFAVTEELRLYLCKKERKTHKTAWAIASTNYLKSQLHVAFDAPCTSHCGNTCHKHVKSVAFAEWSWQIFAVCCQGHELGRIKWPLPVSKTTVKGFGLRTHSAKIRDDQRATCWFHVS